MKGTPYEVIGGLRPGRSMFDLSASKMFDCDLGRLIPVLIEDVLPGDVLEIGASQVTKMQPMVVPLYHRLSISYHTFFVPYRLLWRLWQKFITGGASGDANVLLPQIAYDVLPHRFFRYGIWDYAGFRMDANTDYIELHQPSGVQDFIWRAYWTIWRDYYRDENLQPYYPGSVIPVGQDEDEQMAALDQYMELGIAGAGYSELQCDKLAYRAFAKDYYTSALPWQQRGTSPVIPIAGTSSAVWTAPNFSSTIIDSNFSAANVRNNVGDSTMFVGPTGGSTAATNLLNLFNDNSVNFTAAGTDIADLRYAVQLQKWMERSARGGYRYNEYLLAHFGTAPSDERLQRPEYIGGMMQPIITSEVLQTSSTDATSPQGGFAGHGMAVGNDFCGKYHAKEHGILMGIMSIMPEAVYQQGVPRKWTKQTRFDYYSPEFAHLSEQEIKLSELFYQNDPADDTRFGFQGAYDEYRTNQSVVCGKLATSLKYWTLSRIFATPPSLNEAFITTKNLSETRREAWAVPGVESNSQGEFLVRWNNHIRALRPMPYIPDPGLIDHF